VGLRITTNYKSHITIKDNTNEKNHNIKALCLSTITFADDSFYTANPTNAKSGIIIEPLSKINPPKEILSSINEQKTKGYSEKDSSDALEMLRANKRGYAAQRSPHF